MIKLIRIINNLCSVFKYFTKIIQKLYFIEFDYHTQFEEK